MNLDKRTSVGLLVMLLVGVFILNVVSAGEYETHKQNAILNYSFTSNNATQCNLTTGNTPNGLVSINQIASKSGQTFNITILDGNFSKLGNYCYNIVCTDGINIETGSFCREITYTGEKITTEQTYVYIISLVFLVLLSMGLVFVINQLPSSDSKDESGLIIKINMLKHLRPILWVGVWCLGLACLFIISNIGLAYLPVPMIGNLFFNLFRIMFWVTIIGVPIYFIWIFYKVFTDKETQRLIERGVDIRTP